MKKLRSLVTAGNTIEPIDDVRAWTNIFSGKTGLDIAMALLDLGDVTLLTSNLDHAEKFDGYYGKAGMLGVETFRTHAQLDALLADQMSLGGIDAVAMTAAVSDYTPAGVFRVDSRTTLPDGRETWTVSPAQAPKVKSSYDHIAILGDRTEKLVDKFRTVWHYSGVLIKFKLEVGITEPQLLEIAELSRRASSANAIVANTLEMVRGPSPSAFLLRENTPPQRIPRPALATAVRDLIAQLAARE